MDLISRRAAIEAFMASTSDGDKVDWCKYVLEQLPPAQARPKGAWIRMSDLPDKDDDRYKCSCCENVVHYKNEMDLYTFNSWCGRCGSDNRK